MTETKMMSLGLLEAAQAQKHVSVNEALLRLDALGSRQVLSSALAEPPASTLDGDRFVVAPGATGVWAGHDADIAFRVNDGWEFCQPWRGLRLWDEAASAALVFDGAAWRSDLVALSPGGASLSGRIVEFEHVIGAGSVSLTPAAIPDKAVVLGVTARVLDEITGASSWSLGTEADPSRYGSGLGTAAGSYAHGVSSSPLAYYGGTSLALSAEGGSFTGGRVSIAIHMLELQP